MRTSDAFYAQLAREYERTIRQLVPHYDEMLAEVRATLISAMPTSLVDVGCGPGAVARSLLEMLPERCSLTALDGSSAMVEQAAVALAPFADRARVVEGDLRDFEPEGPVDAVYSTLVLHNLSPEERARAVRTIASWLRRGGMFVWGEFLRFEDPAHQAAVVAYRKRFSIDAGCPAEVVERNYAKEAEEDFPPTAAEVLGAASIAGFYTVDLVWAHDAFAVFRLIR